MVHLQIVNFHILFADRALEAVGLADTGRGGDYVEQVYYQLFKQGHAASKPTATASTVAGHGAAVKHPGTGIGGADGLEAAPTRPEMGPLRGGVFRVNTHGGLLGFGAPWEVPAMHSLIEAVAQLRGEAVGRQVPGAKRALVYGNGGIFSASAVAMLEMDHCEKEEAPASKL
jgi:acetyl-CoA acetyltransferase